MNIHESDWPEHEIDEGENNLLNEIWEKLAVPTDQVTDGRAFDDLQQRIQKKLRRRRMLRLSIGSGVAAVIALSFWVFRLPDSSQPTGVYTQLRDMGVEVVRNQVVLTTDDGKVTSLDSMAKIENRSFSDVTLLMSSGKKIAIEKKRMLKLEVPAGRQFQLTLADGTEVWLNAGSSLEYPATFEGCTERRIRLQGEAFFEVKRDTCHPFYVEFGDKECIRVLGTSFNVNAYSGAKVHTTTLVSGKISYTAGELGKNIILLPDQQMKLDCIAGNTEVSRVNASLYATWKDGWIWFENEKLSDLTSRLARMYGIEINLTDRCKDYTFSGKIRFERGIDYIIKLITETTDVICEVKKGIICLK